MTAILRYLRKNPELVLMTGIFLGFQISVCILVGVWLYVGGLV